MASTAEFTLDQQEFLKIYNRLEGKYIYQQMQKIFSKISRDVAKYIVDNLLNGQLVHRRTGTLAGAMRGRAEIINGIPSLRVGVFRGPALAYAGVIDQGTKRYNPDSPYDTIRPKTAKALKVPVGEGVPSDDLVFIKFKQPKNFVIGALYERHSLQNRGRQASLQDVKAAYLLMSQVDIRPRFYLKTGIMQALPQILAGVSEAFNE